MQLVFVLYALLFVVFGGWWFRTGRHPVPNYLSDEEEEGDDAAGSCTFFFCGTVRGTRSMLTPACTAEKTVKTE